MMKRLFSILALVSLMVMVDVSAAQGDTLPDNAYISGVSGHAQKHSLSCEARSAADLAAFWGIRFGENEFLDALPRAENPEQGFVGTPDGLWGSLPPDDYGVHAGPVAATLQAFGLAAEAYKDLSWDDLRKEIDNGRPVIIWVIGQMWAGRAEEYEAPDGSTSRVAAFEHTMILVGYDQTTVQVVDAYTGLYQTYWQSVFLNSWSVLGNMAIFVTGPGDQQSQAPIAATGDTYTVQPGDFLSEVADRFGVPWQNLAELNSITYPYTIYAGQVLNLPGGANSAPSAVDFQIRLPLVQRGHIQQLQPPTATEVGATGATSQVTARVLMKGSYKAPVEVHRMHRIGSGDLTQLP